MDQGILEKLYHQHFNKTFRTAYLVTRDFQLAEDATQEAFLRAFSKRPAGFSFCCIVRGKIVQLCLRC